MARPSAHGAPAALAGSLALAAACGGGSMSEPATQSCAPLTVTHTFDLASHMPAHLAVMFSMSWFGIPAGDPQGPGPDPDWGNTKWGGGCVTTNDPASCDTCVLMGAGDACQQMGAAERQTASRRRPLAGIYSASGKDAEGLERVDLMLGDVRRPCDDGAKIDAWAVQLNGTRDTQAHPSEPQATTSEISYSATLAFLKEADKAGMMGAVIPGDDATWYFHFGKDVGLGACDDSTGNPKQSCVDALTQDFADMAVMAMAHPSALKLAGKPVLFMYFDPAYLTPGQWTTLLGNARDQSGTDFYVVASSQNASDTSYFAALDGMSPWVQLDWSGTSGSTVRAHATAWTAGMHDPLYTDVGLYPGRVVFGAVTPGFDDYTEDWGQCTERQLPPGDPRDPQVLLGEFDYFASKHTSGLVMQTWDDWTEGTEFEPDVVGGSSVLVSLRQQLGALFGEAADPAGDTRLAKRWANYGQARNCSGGKAGTPPLTTLACPATGGSDAGADGGTDGGTASLDAGGDAASGTVAGSGAANEASMPCGK